MSGWLRHLIVQSRTTQRVVRPAAGASLATTVGPNGAPSSIDAEESGVVHGAPSTAAPPAQARTANEPATLDPETTARRPARNESASPSRRDPRRESSQDVDAAQVRSAGRRLISDDASPRHEDPARLVDEPRSSDVPALAAARLETAPSLRRGTSTSTSIRPAPPARTPAPIREGEAAGQPAPVPDVHIHIGRLELTAVTAPAPPRRERAASSHKPMSLEEYLRRRDGGER